MNKSTIARTEYSRNPITGCTKISPGCKNCYAERVAAWAKRMGQKKNKNEFNLTCHPMRFIQIFVGGNDLALTDEYYRGGATW